MESPLPANILTCTQCGGELHPDEGQLFLTCPYCSSTVYLDKSKVVFHWYLAPTLDEAEARGALARWMAGNQTVKDLDRKARLVSSSFEYFPAWYFKLNNGSGQEKIILQPAAATSVSEIRQVKLPAGDLRKYDPQLEPESVAPTVPLQAALSWMSEGERQSSEIAEQALVHIPLYTFKYVYNGAPYTTIVEAGTGQVFANIFPAKSEAPYMLAGALTALTFLCLATFPLAGALVQNSDGALVGLGVCAALGLVAAPFLFALATWVAAKI